MRTFIYLFIAAGIFTTVSCKKQTIEEPINVEQKLIGKWKFENMIMGLTGTKYVAVPSQVDVIEFKADHSFIKTTNNEFTGQGTYTIIQSTSIFTKKNDNVLIYNLEGKLTANPSVISITTDTLRLSENVYDGNSITYSHVK